MWLSNDLFLLKKRNIDYSSSHSELHESGVKSVFHYKETKITKSV